MGSRAVGLQQHPSVMESPTVATRGADVAEVAKEPPDPSSNQEPAVASSSAATVEFAST